MLDGTYAYPVEHPEVRMILFENGDYPRFMIDGTMNDFYESLLDSPYIDWLSEYNTKGKTINRGKFTGVYKINVRHDYESVINLTMYRDMFDQIEHLKNISIIPPETNDTIYMFHFPTNISCSWIGGSHFGRNAFIYDCSWMRLPLRKDTFWIGVLFVAIFLNLLAIWPILSCNTLKGFGHFSCGFDISGKTIYHCSMITITNILFFVGGFITGIAYVNNQEKQFITGIGILCASGAVFGIWVLSLIPILGIPKLTNWKCCFNKQKICITLKTFTIIYIIALLISATIGGVLVGISFGSNVQITASHELMEIIAGNWIGPTPNISLSNAGYSLGIGNYCQFEWDPIIGKNGSTHYVQKGWSNIYQKCISGL